MIKTLITKDKATLNKAATHPLQSWEWGEFRKKTGNEKVWPARVESLIISIKNTKPLKW